MILFKQALYLKVLHTSCHSELDSESVNVGSSSKGKDSGSSPE